jgi:hypothetical protein
MHANIAASTPTSRPPRQPRGLHANIAASTPTSRPPLSRRGHHTNIARDQKNRVTKKIKKIRTSKIRVVLMAPRRAACVALRHDMPRRPPLLASTLLAIPHTQARREVVVMCKNIKNMIVLFTHVTTVTPHYKNNSKYSVIFRHGHQTSLQYSVIFRHGHQTSLQFSDIFRHGHQTSHHVVWCPCRF